MYVKSEKLAILDGMLDEFIIIKVELIESRSKDKCAIVKKKLVFQTNELYYLFSDGLNFFSSSIVSSLS